MALKNAKFYEYPNVMIDIETLSKALNACVCTVGLINFDIHTGESLTEYDVSIDMEDAINRGLHVDGSTLTWWLKQSDEARAQLTDSPIELAVALEFVRQFINDHRTDGICLWANSPSFDMIRLENAYTLCEIPIPWKYWELWDVRSIAGMNPDVKDSIKLSRNKTAHKALDDCKNQIEYLVAVLNSLQSK